jgi:hypothetical protein
MRLTGKMENVQLFDRAVAGLAHDFEDMRPTLEEVIEQGFYPIMQEVFDTEGRGRWGREEMNADYVRRKRRRHGDKPILQATGGLMRSMTRKNARGNVQFTVGDNTIVAGSDLRHARPQDRRFSIVEFTDGDTDRMADIAEESMKERAERRGFKAR